MRKGSKMSIESRRKLSESHKGLRPWNTGQNNHRWGKESYFKGKKHNEETKLKMSLAKKGKVSPKKGKKGKSLTIEQRKHLSSFWKGEKSKTWKGGITPINTTIRNSLEYKLWREAVFKRDNYTCVWCLRKEEVSGKLNADHIKQFAYYPELRFAIDNGRTLCEDCHRKTETYARKQ